MKNNVKIGNWRKHGNARSRNFKFNAPSGNQYDSGVGFNVTEMDMKADGTWLHNALNVHMNHNKGFEFEPELSNHAKGGTIQNDFVVLDLANNVKIFMTPEQFDELQRVVKWHDPRDHN